MDRERAFGQMIENTYDPDAYDALVLVERMGGDTFSAGELGMLLGAPSDNAGRKRVLRLRARGVVPAPDFPGNGITRDRWSKRQVVGVVARHRANAKGR